MALLFAAARAALLEALVEGGGVGVLVGGVGVLVVVGVGVVPREGGGVGEALLEEEVERWRCFFFFFFPFLEGAGLGDLCLFFFDD